MLPLLLLSMTPAADPPAVTLVAHDPATLATYRALLARTT